MYNSQALIIHFSLVCCYLTALCLNISLGTLVSNAFHLFSSLRMTDQVSPPYIIIVIVIVISVEVSGVNYDRAPNGTRTRTLQRLTCNADRHCETCRPAVGVGPELCLRKQTYRMWIQYCGKVTKRERERVAHIPLAAWSECRRLS